MLSIVHTPTFSRHRGPQEPLFPVLPAWQIQSQQTLIRGCTNKCKGVLQASKSLFANRMKHRNNFDSRDYWCLCNLFNNIPPFFTQFELLRFYTNKVNYFTSKFSANSTLDSSAVSLYGLSYRDGRPYRTKSTRWYAHKFFHSFCYHLKSGSPQNMLTWWYSCNIP